jgi:hypothetical protein
VEKVEEMAPNFLSCFEKEAGRKSFEKSFENFCLSRLLVSICREKAFSLSTKLSKCERNLHKKAQSC